MKIITFLLAFYLLGSCSDANQDEVEGWSDEVASSVDTSMRNDGVDGIDLFELSNQLETIPLAQLNQIRHETDSIQTILTSEIVQLFKHLQSNELGKVQQMLHPKGLYYYTLGRIAPETFNLSTLKERKGRLKGAYEMTDEYNLMQIDSMVNGLFWLDSLRNNYTDNAPDWHEGYGAVAYGFSGNYSSDHIDLEYELDFGESNLYHIAYINHNSEEIDHRDILMLEFFQDDMSHWKLYAISNLEWTS
ncbi:MAG: hypothetical protein ACI8ZM_003173 [Crocinitomix sp.]|jgi:hypothetical protein